MLRPFNLIHGLAELSCQLGNSNIAHDTKLLNSDHHMLLLSGYSRHLEIDTKILSSFFEYLIYFIYLESAPDNF